MLGRADDAAMSVASNHVRRGSYQQLLVGVLSRWRATPKVRDRTLDHFIDCVPAEVGIAHGYMTVFRAPGEQGDCHVPARAGPLA